MNVILYLSFAYMVLHLIYVGFKKGEQFNVHLRDTILPTYRNGDFEDFRLKMIKLSLKIKSIFSTKNKLVLKEIDKPYDIPFDKKLIDLLSEKESFSKDIFDIVKMVYDFKERKEYLSFDFDDSLLLSRRVQFINMYKKIHQEQSKNFHSVMYQMFLKENIKEVEENDWKDTFAKSKFLNPEDEAPREVDFVGRAFEHQTVPSSDTAPVDVSVVLRDVKKRQKVKFDRKKEK